MTTIEPMSNHIIFQFKDDKVKHMGVNQFEEKTDWNFTFVRSDESAGLARFGVVTHVGPDVSDDIVPGVIILIDSLKWTNEFEVDGKKYWRTDESHVLGIQE